MYNNGIITIIISHYYNGSKWPGISEKKIYNKIIYYSYNCSLGIYKLALVPSILIKLNNTFI